MPTGSKYATGDRAWGLCQICGLRFLLRDLVFDGYYPNLRVCVPCYDPRQPQEFLVDVTDPTALWRPSPEWGPENQALSALIFANEVQLSWTECILRGQPRVNTYLLYRSVSADEVNFSASVLIATLPVLYYSDLADLNENGNPPYNNQGIEAETLNFQDTVPDGVNFVRYQVFAKLDGGRMVNSNLVTLPVISASGKDSIQSAGTILGGDIAAFLPPVNNSTESIQSAGTLISGLITAVDPFFADVSLLLHMDGANGSTAFPDSSSNNLAVTVLGTTVDTANPLYGTGAALLSGDATTSSLTLPIVPGGPLDIQGEDFTLEFSLYVAAFHGPASAWIVIGTMPGAETQGFYIRVDPPGNLIGAVIRDSTIRSIGTSFALSLDTWYQIAFQRASGLYAFYIDGVNVVNIVPFFPGAIDANSGTLNIGGNFPGLSVSGVNGQIDELRLTKGVARYSGTYTPTGPFANS